MPPIGPATCHRCHRATASSTLAAARPSTRLVQGLVGRLTYDAAVTRYAIDAKTLLHLVGEGISACPEHQLVAPNLIRSQALNLLFEAVRSGELSEKYALAQHERLTETKMRLLGDRVSRRTAWQIAFEQGWQSTYDAEYVAVAKLQADALVTIDAALATKAKGIVLVAGLNALWAR